MNLATKKKPLNGMVWIESYKFEFIMGVNFTIFLERNECHKANSIISLTILGPKITKTKQLPQNVLVIGDWALLFKV